MIKKYLELEVTPGRTILCDVSSERKEDCVIIRVKEEADQVIHFSHLEILHLIQFLKTNISRGVGIL